MIGIYFICLLLFPSVVLMSLKFLKKEKLNFISKDDSLVLRGIAAILVIFSHYTAGISDSAGIIKIYGFCGGIGVLVFFFLSGYGVYLSNIDKPPTVIFLQKRILNVYMPYILMKIVFNIIKLMFLESHRLSIGYFFMNSFGLDRDDWFIKVIMIQYLIFFIAWKFVNKKFLLPVTGIICFITSFLFYILHFEPRWFNGFMLFWIGMLVAEYKDKFIIFTQKRYLFKTISLILIFFISALLYQCITLSAV